jgi:hypothetical protein
MSSLPFSLAPAILNFDHEIKSCQVMLQKTLKNAELRPQRECIYSYCPLKILAPNKIY